MTFGTTPLPVARRLRSGGVNVNAALFNASAAGGGSWSWRSRSATSVADLARERPDDVAYVHIALGGDERVVRWEEFDRRSSQLAGIFAERATEADEYQLSRERRGDVGGRH